MLIERNKRLELRKTKEFKSTNEIWNELGLNHAWTIGFMTKIFAQKDFSTFEEWETYYFETGKRRLELISELPHNKKLLLRDITGNCSNSYFYKKNLNRDEVQLNECYGRTLDEIKHIANFMHQQINLKGNFYKITKENCFNFTYVRIIDEIFIGAQREMNTIIKLKKLFPKLVFTKTTDLIDKDYAVDCEVFHNNNLICGIQIKSDAYFVSSDKMLTKTKEFNQKKNQKYTEKYKVPVYYVYSSTNGYISNSDIFSVLNKIKSQR